MTSTGTAAQPTTEDRLYRIGEVSRLSELKPFVLRYWETEFPMLEPVKSPSGHRMYRQQDVDMVFKIKRLLYDEGFTIAGARRHLRETNGAINVYVTDATDLIIDINGYFAANPSGGYEFFPVTPCRLVDTRVSSFPSGFGPPSMSAAQSLYSPERMLEPKPASREIGLR